MNFIGKKDRTIILFFSLVSLLLVTIWFKNGNLFLGAEEGVPFYNLDLTLKIYSATWLEEFLGIAYLIDIAKMPFFSGLAFLQNLGINSFFLQTGTFFLFLAGGSLSCYFLFQRLFKDIKMSRLAAFMGALFYLLNPYSIGDVWSRGIYNQFFAYLYYPLFLWLFVLYLDKAKYLYLFLGLLISFIFSSAMGNPSYAISLWVLMGVYFLVYFLKNIRNISEIKKITLGMFVYFTGWVMINSWWLIVFVAYAPSAYLTEGSGFQNALESFQAVSQQVPFINTIRLFHAIRFGSDFYGTVYDNWGLILISFLLPLVIFCSARWYKSFSYTFLASLFVAGFIVCMGSNPPFGAVFTYLFEHVSLVQVFRNPYEKFGLVYLLAYSALYGLGMLSIYQFLSRATKSLQKTVAGIILLVIVLQGFLVWPMWTGALIGWGTQSQIPNKYSQINQWLSINNPKDHLTLFLPFLPSLGASYNWGGDYHGNDPIYQLISTSVLTQEGTIPYLMALKKEIGNQDVSGALALLRIRYLITRPEVVVSSENILDLVNIVSKQEKTDTELINTISDSQIFQLNNYYLLSEVDDLAQIRQVKSFNELFYEANKVDLNQTQFVVSNGQKSNFVTDAFFTSKINLFKKFDQMRFLIHFDNSDPKLFYLAKTFNTEWKVVPLNSDVQMEDTFFNNLKLLFLPRLDEKEHFVINGYANGWITNHTGQIFGIVYMPQVLMKVLWPFAQFVFSICLITSLLIIFKDNNFLKRMIKLKGFDI